MTQPSDEDLMLALRQGELSAFDALFRRHYETVRSLAARLIPAASDGDDVAQETFLRVLRHRGTYRGDARFTTWLHRIARNVCLEHATRQARERRLAERWTVDAEDRAPVDGGDDAELLAKAMDSLSQEYREVLVLCRFQDLPFAEVAEVLGCSPGAARVRAHRALVALRERYDALAGGERRRASNGD